MFAKRFARGVPENYGRFGIGFCEGLDRCEQMTCVDCGQIQPQYMFLVFWGLGFRVDGRVPSI